MSALFSSVVVRLERLRCLFRRMKRLQGFVRWLLIAFGFGVIGLIAAHLALRPNPKIAASEQYNVLSAYIEPNLTGESHDLGSSNGLVVIDRRTTFSRPLANSNKFKQYVSLLASTGRAKAKIPQLGRSLVFEFWAANLRGSTLAGSARGPGTGSASGASRRCRRRS